MPDAAVDRPIPVQILTGHADAVWRCVFSPDGYRIASASRDQTVKLWDGLTGALQGNLTGHRGWVRTCAFSADGARLVSGSRDRTLKLWDPATGAELRTLKGHTDEVNRVTFCLGGARIASGSLDGTVRLWDSATGAQVDSLGCPMERVQVLVASPDGKLVAAAQDQWVTVWDAERATRVATIRQADLVRALAFAPDGERLLTGAGRGALTLWATRTGEQLASFTGHDSYITACAFAPDGKRLASASNDHTVRVWDAETQLLTSLLAGHTAPVTACAFAGKFLISASDDKTLRWWNALTGAALATLTGHTDEIHSVAFAADGTRIVSASHDKTLRLWILQAALREPERHAPSRIPGKGYGPRLFAFLSYRRESGAETARLIRAELLARGLKSFLDVDDLGAHHFDESLLRRIEEAAHFILVLSPGALDRCANEGDWLRREIAHAISTGRNVVPVLKEGFHFPPRETLPAELADLPRYNCVEYSHIYFGATMGRVLAFCGLEGT